jgi:hemerythrin
MSFFTWQDKFSVGIDVIDADHKILVDLIDQLHGAFVSGNVDDTVNSVLAALVDYTQYHFTREEVMLAAAGYPGLAAHKRAHAELRRQLDEIYDRFLSGNANGKLGNEVLAFLHDWLYFHILEQDKEYQATLAIKP